MENKGQSIHYLNNGKVAQNYLIHSTKLKGEKEKNFSATNGKFFNKELTSALQQNSLKKLNLNKNEEANVVSWLMNTLNPINHIPIVSTINKMANKTSEPLDVVQAAIGGTIYGGGPIGLAKGIAGWLVNKLVPTNKIASNTEVIKDVASENKISNESNKSLNNIPSTKNFNKSSKINLKDSEQGLVKINDLPVNHKKSINNSFLNYHFLQPKQRSKIVDIDA